MSAYDFAAAAVSALTKAGKNDCSVSVQKRSTSAWDFSTSLVLSAGSRPDFDQILATFVIILFQLRQPVAMRRQRRWILKGEGHLQIGFDHVFRRRKDVRDEVVAEFDLVVDAGRRL